MNRNLQDILYKAGGKQIIGKISKEISSVCMDSRKAEKDCLFVAVKGSRADGHNFINQVINKGATAIVCQNLPDELDRTVTYIRVNDSSYALAIIASNFYSNPSENLKLIGITGTNGKTTTVSLLYRLFMAMGFKTGLLSTIDTRINENIYSSTHTTPDALSINMRLAEMRDVGCEFVFMEVSSHAIHQNRIAGLDFDVAIFSNITHDHLDYHKSFKEYINAKKKFFDMLKPTAYALVNIDDKNGRVMLQNTQAHKITYSLKRLADYKAKVIEHHIDGMLMEINSLQFYSLLAGDFNAYNALAVYATANLLGFKPDEILTHLSTLKGAEGRFEIIRKPNANISAIVDYAHTPDALLNIIKTIKNLQGGNGRLIVVVGAGGNRDKSKRPKMAAIASSNAELTILTSDNPRNENPEAILSDMKAGIDPAKKSKCLVISNRKEAIKTAVTLANDGDIILVAGKGHEKYQEILGVKHPFDDKKIIEELFELE